MLTLLGTLLGGLFRLAPEWLKYLNGKQDRAHEVTMFGLQLDADKVKAAAAKELATVEGANALNLAEVNAMIEATKAQGQLTGVKWVDGVNATVRPFLTYWWAVILYTAAIACEFYFLVVVVGKPGYEAMGLVFGEPEKALVGSMISFWFVDRALRKMTGR
jgi:hypothetical protein